MTEQTCPVCTMNTILEFPEHWECETCGHEWAKDADEIKAGRVVVDAFGNELADGDSVSLIKDLKLKGSSDVLKQGTKVSKIRIVDGDHEIDCRINGQSMALKACFVKKS